MRPREDALSMRGLVALAAVVAIAALPGCGAIFHSSQHVEIVTKPEDKAVAYAGGAELKSIGPGRFEAPVFLGTSVRGTPIVIAPGRRIAEAKLERHVDPLAIVFDALWTLTILGVAAPISDAALGTFTKTSSPVDVTLVPDSPDPNPMPTYAVAGVLFPSVDEPVVAPALKPSVTGTPAPAPSPAPVPPAPPATKKRSR